MNLIQPFRKQHVYLVEFRNNQVLTVILILSKIICDLQTINYSADIIFKSIADLCLLAIFRQQ